MAITFDQAIDKVLDERRTRQDIQIPLEQFNLGLDADGKNIVGTIDGRDYVPTTHALKQMANIMDVSHAVLNKLLEPATKTQMRKGITSEVVKYNRDQTDRELLVALFKNGIRDGRVDPKKEFKFRTYTDGTLRAMLTDKYAIVDNIWYINHLREVCKTLGGDEPKFQHWGGDADTIYGNLLMPSSLRTGSDSDYGGMLSIKNCEIGKARISITPAVWRQICTNGMMGWARGQTWSKVHRGDIDLHGLADDITFKINETVPILNEGIDSLINTQTLALTAKPSEVIAQIALESKLSSGMSGQAVRIVDEYGKHEAGFRNMFGIINAITRAAQTYDPAEQFRLEEIGGELLQLGQGGWESLNRRAADMKKEQRDKILGHVAI